MTRKLTKKELHLMVSELLATKPLFDRFKELEKKIRQGMVDLEVDEVQVTQGRAFITQSERVNISPELAIDVLGEQKAKKVIVIKKSVANNLVEAFLKAGEISQGDYEAMWKRAERKPVVSLYIRPLK